MVDDIKTKEEIYLKLVEIIAQVFEIDKANIDKDSRFIDDLDLDSIDLIDLLVELQKITNEKISPNAFRSIRTIEDAVSVIYEFMEKKQE